MGLPFGNEHTVKPLRHIGDLGKNGKRGGNGGFRELLCLHERHEDQIWDTLLSMIREELGIDTHMVTPETRFVEDLGADWLDLVDMVIAAARRFDLDIPDEDVAALVTVEDVFACLTKHWRTDMRDAPVPLDDRYARR